MGIFWLGETKPKKNCFGGISVMSETRTVHLGRRLERTRLDIYVDLKLHMTDQRLSAVEPDSQHLLSIRTEPKSA